MLQRDAPAFANALSRLHPSPKRREVALVLLSKLAHKICRPHSVRLRSEEGGYGGDFTQDELVAPRFTPMELAELWERFAPLEVGHAYARLCFITPESWPSQNG